MRKQRWINRIELLYRLQNTNVPISWPTIDKRMLAGTFPDARKEGMKWVWLESDIEAFIAGTWTAPRVKAEA